MEDTRGREKMIESERRRKVADEKVWGAIIEAVERLRKAPIARSIVLRLYFLLTSIDTVQEIIKGILKEVDPLRIASSSTTKETNHLIRTYNDVIEDLHSHFGKKDAYVRKFSLIKELEEPTIDDVIDVLFIIQVNIGQIASYMTRWA